jgi:hypothetical protein
MKRMMVWLGVVLLLSVMAVSAQKKAKRKVKPDITIKKTEAKNPYKQLKLEEQKMELEFKRQMQKLELDKKRLQLAQQRQRMGKAKSGWHKRAKRKGAVMLAWCLVINILLTIWVYQDMRKRNAGSGLWVAITLFAGVFGALIYAVARLGDTQKKA